MKHDREAAGRTDLKERSSSQNKKKVFVKLISPSGYCKVIHYNGLTQRQANFRRIESSQRQVMLPIGYHVSFAPGQTCLAKTAYQRRIGCLYCTSNDLTLSNSFQLCIQIIGYPDLVLLFRWH